MDTPDESVWKPGTHCLALDGVRGIAILSVTIYRLCKELDPSLNSLFAFVKKFAPVGERGVDLFFVLSGFLITGILIRSRSKPFYFRNFLIRRSLRIFPLYFLSLTIGLILVPLITSPKSLEVAAANQIYLWTYTSNLKMSWDNEWSFGAFDHFWSLCVEEHFYFVWPAIVLLFSTRRLGFLCVGLFLVIGIARTLAVRDPGWDVAASVATFFRADSLALGALVAVLFSLRIPEKTIRRAGLLIAVCLFPALLVIAISGRRFMELPNSICPAFLAAGMAYILLSPRVSIWAKVLESRALCFFGKYSYGMYVFQLPLVSFLPMRIAIDSMPIHASWSSLFYVGFMFASIVAMAFVSFHLFEKHFLRWKATFA